jgi:Family of unknown function (DUF5317)
MLLLYSIAIGLVVGKLAGGSLAALAEVRLHWMGLALVGLVGQLVLFSGPVAQGIGTYGPALYVASTLMVLAALLRNVRQPGIALLAVGAALNLVAILSNGGYMPSAAAAWAGLNGVATVPATGYTNSLLINAGTLFPFLGDVFYLPRPIPLANVFSIGDVTIAIGAVWFLVAAMRGRALGAQPASDSSQAPNQGHHPRPAAGDVR